MTLFWHLCRTNAWRSATVLLIAFSIVMLGRFARYIKMATRHDIDPELIPAVLFWNLPNIMLLLLPLALMLGLGLSLMRLHSEGELLAWYNCGLSRNRLGLALSLPAIALLPLTLCLSLWWVPLATKRVDYLVDSPDRNFWLRHISTASLEAVDQRQLFADLGDYTHDQARLRNVVLINNAPAEGEFVMTVAADGNLLARGQEGIFVHLDAGTTYRDYRNSLELDISRFSSLRRFLDRNEAGRRRPSDSLELAPSAELWQSTEAAARAELYWRVNVALVAPLLCFAALVSMGGARPVRRLGSGGLFYVVLIYWLCMSLLLSARDWDMADLAGVTLFWSAVPLLGAALLCACWYFRPGAVFDKIVASGKRIRARA